MKILLTVHQFFPSYGAGTEVLTMSVARELKLRGHEVYVFTGHPASKLLRDEARFDRYSVEDFPVFRFHHAHAPIAGQQVVAEIEYDNHLAARFFGQILEEVNPDVVHFFHLGRLGSGLIDLAVKTGVPAYYTPTDFWVVCPFNQLTLDDGRACSGPSAHAGNCVKHMAMRTSSPPLANAIKLMPDRLIDVLTAAAAEGRLPSFQRVKEAAAVASRLAFNVKRMNSLQRIFSPTQLMSESLIANGVERERIEHLAFGIDLSSFGSGDRAPRREGEPLRMGFIGTLLPHKGCHVLVDAFRRLTSGTARLEIYGGLSDSSEYVERLRQLAAGSTTIEFRGTFPHSDLAKVLSGLDVLVVPSLWHENTPLVVYAALAARCPVVASDYRGITGVVEDERNGLIFPPGDVKGLQWALERLVQGPDLLARLRGNCRPPKPVTQYVSELLNVYEKDRDRE